MHASQKSTFSLSYLLKAGAVGALAELVNERPFEEQTSEQLHSVYSSLTQPFPVLLFLLAAVKHKRSPSDGAEVSSVIEWLGYTKAMKRLMALSTMRVFISCASSYGVKRLAPAKKRATGWSSRMPLAPSGARAADDFAHFYRTRRLCWLGVA
jgi:hypothetical protein